MVKHLKYPGPVKEQWFLNKDGVKVSAIQFSGINGNDVVDYIEERGGSAKNNGTWVSAIFSYDETDLVYETVIRKYDMVVMDGELMCFEFSDFVAGYEVDLLTHILFEPLNVTLTSRH